MWLEPSASAGKLNSVLRHSRDPIKPTGDVSACQNGENPEGDQTLNTSDSLVSPLRLVVNGFSARLLEMVLSPRDRLTSSLFWSAKEIEGYGGKETSANLAAILEALLTLDVGF